MHGRKSLLAIFLVLTAGCSGNSLMTPDCHSCTIEEQAWKDFSFGALAGQWKGTVETISNERTSAKRNKSEKKVELRFLSAADFLKARSASCDSVPADAVVLNGQLWEGGRTNQEFETFLPAEGDKVAYGRLSFEKVNGKEFCRFRRLGRVMGKNRLALPTVAFSEGSTVSGRGIASVKQDAEYNLEFLRHAPVPKKSGRGPASVVGDERPPLMLRISRTTSRDSGARGEWSGSEERLYRLWKAE